MDHPPLSSSSPSQSSPQPTPSTTTATSTTIGHCYNDNLLILTGNGSSLRGSLHHAREGKSDCVWTIKVVPTGTEGNSPQSPHQLPPNTHSISVLFPVLNLNPLLCFTLSLINWLSCIIQRNYTGSFCVQRTHNHSNNTHSICPTQFTQMNIIRPGRKRNCCGSNWSIFLVPPVLKMERKTSKPKKKIVSWKISAEGICHMPRKSHYASGMKVGRHGSANVLIFVLRWWLCTQ